MASFEDQTKKNGGRGEIMIPTYQPSYESGCTENLDIPKGQVALVFWNCNYLIYSNCNLSLSAISTKVTVIMATLKTQSKSSLSQLSLSFGKLLIIITW